MWKKNGNSFDNENQDLSLDISEECFHKKNLRHCFLQRMVDYDEKGMWFLIKALLTKWACQKGNCQLMKL